MNIKTDQFEMHRLEQLSPRKWLELNNELEKWNMKYLRIISEAFPVWNYESWTIYNVLFLHAEVVLKYYPFTALCYLELITKESSSMISCKERSQESEKQQKKEPERGVTKRRLWNSTFLYLALHAAVASTAPIPIDDTTSLAIIYALLLERSSQPDPVTLSKRVSHIYFLAMADSEFRCR